MIYMVKIFLSIYILLFLLPNISKIYAQVKPIYPPNGAKLENRTILFKWENISQDKYVYMYEYSLDRDFSIAVRPPCDMHATECLQGFGKRIYYWRVRYHPASEFIGVWGYMTDTYIFTTGEEIPKEELEGKPKKPPVVYPEIKVIHEEKEIMNTNIKESKTLPPIEIKNVHEEGFSWDVSTSIKGVNVGFREKGYFCILKHTRRSTKYHFLSCNLSLLTNVESQSYPFSNMFTTIVTGKLDRNVKVNIREYSKNGNYLKDSDVDLKLNMIMRVRENGRLLNTLSYDADGDSFYIVAGHSKGVEGLELEVILRLYNSRIDLFEDLTLYSTLKPKVEKSIYNGPFVFPFKNLVGVTQWYGYTAYQKPHTGIDFGVSKLPVLAIGDGEVVSAGLHKSGECNSGGKYITVKQTNGMYVGYFHLDSFKIKVGERIKVGDVLGISGNTGAWNCQGLRDHLHFVVRRNSQISSHVNPVKYVNADWDRVPTLDYKRYPGRLSGENPHPGK